MKYRAYWIGGRVGVMAVLHTWGSNLSYHLHVHCLVIGGGLSSDGHTWMPARDDYLAPFKALSRRFRRIFLKSIKRRFKDIRLPKYIWQKEWVAHSKPAVQGTRTVLNYLARYIHRVAITNSRIISADVFYSMCCRRVFTKFATMVCGVPRIARSCVRCNKS